MDPTPRVGIADGDGSRVGDGSAVGVPVGSAVAVGGSLASGTVGVVPAGGAHALNKDSTIVIVISMNPGRLVFMLSSPRNGEELI